MGPTLGRGEFASVKLAFNLRTGANVAMKCFKPRCGTYLMVDEQILREVLAMKGLTHPHIVELYEVIVYGDRVFLVMEYCPLGDLRRYINRRGPLSEHQARLFLGHMALAVKKMHSMDLIHRDLKLENLVIDSSFRLKIADFGCARRQISKTLNTITGSYAYGAPELFRGDHYDGRKTDVWSMGVVLYAMLVGQLPFNDKGRLRNLLWERMRVPSLPHRLSRNCCDLIRKMLTYDPSHRISLNSLLAHPWMMGYES